LDFLKQFEPDVFWQQHGRKILWGVGIVLAIVLVVVWRQRQAAREETEAAMRLATAGDAASLSRIIQDYRGKEVAAQAAFRLAGLQFQQGNYPAAGEAYQSFLTQFPNHPLRESAQLGLAIVQEAEGNFEGAKTQYHQIVAEHPNGYTSVAARMGEARCAEALGQVKEARQMYEELLAMTQNSPWQAEAYLRWTVLSRSPEAAAPPPIAPQQSLTLSPPVMPSTEK
jgi:TolA-binding protein